jgi:hypothetical protein
MRVIDDDSTGVTVLIETVTAGFFLLLVFSPPGGHGRRERTR